MATEAQLQNKVMAWLRQQPGFWRKISGGSFQQSGLPDIIGCLSGLYIAIELKHESYGDNPERGLTVEQEHVAEEILKNNGVYLCTNKLEDVKRMVAQIIIAHQELVAEQVPDDRRDVPSQVKRIEQADGDD